MNYIQTKLGSLDTNVFIFGLRRTPGYEACVELLQRLSELRLIITYPVLLELQHNLTTTEMRQIYATFSSRPEDVEPVLLDWTPPPDYLVTEFRARGCKKGDAFVAACVVVAGVDYFISENRHFLCEIKDLPFAVLSCAQVLEQLSSHNL
jgi:predicted nucleic acid-binding protein